MTNFFVFDINFYIFVPFSFKFASIIYPSKLCCFLPVPSFGDIFEAPVHVYSLLNAARA